MRLIDLIPHLDTIAATMKKNGITKLQIADLWIEMPLSPSPIPQEIASIDQNEEEDGICKCGHSYHLHNESGCLQGCSHEACIREGE